MTDHKRVLLSLGAALLLTACGTSGTGGAGGDAPPAPPLSIDPQEGAIPSLAELRAANDPLSVLSRHRTVCAAVECLDAAGETTYSGHVLYTRDDAGLFRADTHTVYHGAEGEADSYLNTAAYAGADRPGAFYYNSSGGLYYINCYPSWEYEAQAAGAISPVSSALDDSETISGAQEQDGVLTVTTTTNIVEINYTYTSVYRFDAQTKLLLSAVITEDDAGGAPAVTTRWEWTYGGSYDPDWESPSVSEAERCDLTLHINPGTDSAETQVLPVSRSSSVNFISQQPFTVYLDEALSTVYKGRMLDVSAPSAVYYIVLES